MESPSQLHRDEFKGLNLQPRYINLIAGPCVQKERGTLSQLLCQRVLFCHYTPMEMKPREVKWPVKVTQDEPASILSWPQPSQCTWGRSLSSTLHSFFLKLASTPFWPPEELFLRCNLVTQKLRFPFLIFFCVYHDLHVIEAPLTMSSLAGAGSDLQPQELNPCTWEGFPAISPSGCGGGGIKLSGDLWTNL